MKMQKYAKNMWKSEFDIVQKHTSLGHSFKRTKTLSLNAQDLTKTSKEEIVGRARL